MTAVCPSCGGNSVPIVYGLPMMEGAEAERRWEIVLGGCVVTGQDPDYRRQECGHERIVEPLSPTPE
jgi:hypothetical protein